MINTFMQSPWLELPLDDLLVVTRRFINPEASRSGLNRLLQREGLSSLHILRFMT
jgi:hypothetical protein